MGHEPRYLYKLLPGCDHTDANPHTDTNPDTYSNPDTHATPGGRRWWYVAYASLNWRHGHRAWR